MQQKRIQVRLTAESIENAIREITEYKQDIKRKLNSLIETLVEDGVFEAKTWIIAYDAYETGDLMNSIEGIFDAESGKGFIKANSDHAAFVEYGTGVIGEENQSLAWDRPSGWAYDTKGHGHDGWHYLDSGMKRWTKGMPPRPYMYQTFLELVKKARDVAKEKMANG